MVHLPHVVTTAITQLTLVYDKHPSS